MGHSRPNRPNTVKPFNPGTYVRFIGSDPKESCRANDAKCVGFVIAGVTGYKGDISDISFGDQKSDTTHVLWTATCGRHRADEWHVEPVATIALKEI